MILFVKVYLQKSVRQRVIFLFFNKNFVYTVTEEKDRRTHKPTP